MADRRIEKWVDDAERWTEKHWPALFVLSAMVAGVVAALLFALLVMAVTD